MFDSDPNNFYNPNHDNSSDGAFYPPSDFDMEISRKQSRISALKEIRYFGRIIGACMIAFVAMPYALVILADKFNFLSLFTEEGNTGHCVNIILSISCYFLPFFIGYLVIQKGRYPQDFPLGKPFSAKLTFYAAVSGLMLCYLSSFLSSYFVEMLEAMGMEFPPAPFYEVPDTLLSFILCVIEIAVVPALSEEFIFRGVIMQPLRKFGDMYAILISSLLFSLAHGNIYQAPFSFLVGIVIGYAAVATGSMWTGILIHFLNNFSSVVFEYIYETFPSYGNKAYFSFLAVIFVGGIATTVLFFFSKKARPVLREQIYTGMGSMRKARVFFFTFPMLLSLTALVVNFLMY